MPGFDGTGPKGMGSMTGRGRGYCVVTIENDSEDKGKNIPDASNHEDRQSPYGHLRSAFSRLDPRMRRFRLSRLGRAWRRDCFAGSYGRSGRKIR